MTNQPKQQSQPDPSPHPLLAHAKQQQKLDQAGPAPPLRPARARTAKRPSCSPLATALLTPLLAQPAQGALHALLEP